MAKTKSKGNPLAVPKSVTAPTGQRAVELPSYLSRVIPSYGYSGWLEASRWRQVVRSQPLAIACRDTLLDNVKNLEWDVVPSDPDTSNDKEIKRAVQYYGDLLERINGGDFDAYIDLMGQDLMDLPFGAAAEIGRENDEPDGPVLWVNHIDAATLFPSYDEAYPVIQSVPEIIGQAIAFPKHAIDRMVYTPRPELRRSGWGMAPPEKVYLALEMLYRGDTYYWKLLLDTPEAGILDLMDMSEEDAGQWLGEFRTLFQGIDGFKVPVLYAHEKPANWIPFNRPPIDLLYDKTIIHYGQILAAGYGMRLSDVGLSQLEGGGTLAGIIREERQTRRSGFANVREKFRNHFNRILPHQPDTQEQVIKFVWIERDDEATVARGRAMLAMGQGLKTLMDSGVIDAKEARHEVVAQGLMETEIDPDQVPEPPEPKMPFGGLFGAGGDGKNAPPGKEGASPPMGQDEKGKVKPEGGATPPSQGGRGSQPAPVGKSISIVDRIFRSRREKPAVTTTNPVTKEAKNLLREMADIVAPGLALIKERAAEYDDVRLIKLVTVATKVAVPKVTPILRALTDDQAEDYWVPQFTNLVFDQDNDFLDTLTIRQTAHEIQAAVEKALEDEEWWQLADEWDKQEFLEMYTAAFEKGMAIRGYQLQVEQCGDTGNA
jgi:hypothetical protein